MDTQCKATRRERGTSLIELMLALLVLAIGLIGSVPLICVAISNNYRSRSDSTSAALAEMIVDQIAAIPVGSSTTTVTIKDCANNSITVNSAGSSTGTGANLSGGNVDYTQSFASVPSGYAIEYTVCGVSNGTQSVYDVRWNVTTVPSGDADFVVVGARPLGAGNNPLVFAQPVNVHTVVGNSGN